MSTDSKFHTWSIEGQRVECAASVLDQITSAARDGFRRFRHGGMEIGGILIGSQERSRVRVVDARPMDITYGRGAVFLLTDADHEALDALVQRTNKEVVLKGLCVVGYYESHTRRDATLSEADFETYDAHFPKPSQVCIVLKPDRENETITAVYIRNQRGEVVLTHLEGETTAKETATELEGSPETQPATTTEFREPEVAPIPAPIAQVEEYIPFTQTLERTSRRWAYAIPVVVLAVVGAAIMWMRGAKSSNSATPPPSSNAIQQPVVPPQAPPSNANVTAEAGSPENSAVKSGGKSKKIKRSRHRRARRR